MFRCEEVPSLCVLWQALTKGTKRGVLFSTYSTLVKTPAKKKSRCDQVVEWCGGSSFEGCLIFDEV